MNSWDFEPSRTLATLGRHVRTAEEHQRKARRPRSLDRGLLACAAVRGSAPRARPSASVLLCPRLDSNQHALRRAQALNLLCMPIPPRGQLLHCSRGCTQGQLRATGRLHLIGSRAEGDWLRPSHPAALRLALMPALIVLSCLSRLRAKCLTIARFSGALPVCTRQSSSPKATSNVQCSEFSMLQ